ncbi:DUF2628 domain-containing protein [Chryseobacterium cheonjiense]|uniref:DUF2628 domain-containing protein n=1 Tax=Chryseobacterium cheonjiense TaxID=2728845 RepID=A0A7Y0A9B1_9FLAO|nr:DUF2628 domain-containing protein [Chryseobacterium cheonjiense]NML58846.1 DUF2628 domain-containing protein [Chryseobacterium cheonjiense]
MEKTELYEAYFQDSSNYYLEQLNYYEKGKKFRFSFSAVLFGVFWFLYRKMYLEFFVIIIIFYAESQFENYVLAELIGTEKTKLLSFVISIILTITMGIIRNNLYLKKAKRMVEQAQMTSIDPEQQKEFLTKKGGTSVLFVMIAFALFVLAVIMQAK